MKLSKIDFTQRVVHNPRMVHKGGDVYAGDYSRTRWNVVTSTGLLDRNDYVAKEVRAACRLGDKCLPSGMSRGAVGRPVPGSPGKTYTECTADEAIRRLTANLGCVTPILSTSGGIYGSA